MVLPVVLCGCDTRSVMLREEHGLRVCENRVLGKIHGPERKDITGNWRKLHYDQLHCLYSSPNVIRVLKWIGLDWQRMWHVWGRRNAYRILIGKHEGKRLLWKI